MSTIEFAGVANELNCLYLCRPACFLGLSLLHGLLTIADEPFVRFYECYRLIPLRFWNIQVISLNCIRCENRHALIHSRRIQQTVIASAITTSDLYRDVRIYMSRQSRPSNEKTHRPQSSCSLLILIGLDCRLHRYTHVLFTSVAFAQIMFPSGTVYLLYQQPHHS